MTAVIHQPLFFTSASTTLFYYNIAILPHYILQYVYNSHKYTSPSKICSSGPPSFSGTSNFAFYVDFTFC